MEGIILTVSSCPSSATDLALAGIVLIHYKDFLGLFGKIDCTELFYIQMENHHIFSVMPINEVEPGQIGFNAVQRQSSCLKLRSRVKVVAYDASKCPKLNEVTISVNCLNKNHEEGIEKKILEQKIEEYFAGKIITQNQECLLDINGQRFILFAKNCIIGKIVKNETKIVLDIRNTKLLLPSHLSHLAVSDKINDRDVLRRIADMVFCSHYEQAINNIGVKDEIISDDVMKHDEEIIAYLWPEQSEDQELLKLFREYKTKREKTAANLCNKKNCQ